MSVTRAAPDRAAVEAELHAVADPLISFIAGKHVGYGASFDRIFGTYGLPSIGPRLADKYHRIEHCLLHPDDPGAGDKLTDAIKDLVGYCLLTLRHTEGVVDDAR